MSVILLMVGVFAAYLVAYHTYGKFLSKKIFKLDPSGTVPSKTHNDGVDYVPTRKSVIFGHHFTSIAGTGPIVGPAIGVIWGWLPALLWVLLGSIFMGAVHDFGSLVLSLRNDGKSISDITRKYLGKRAYLIFFFIVFFSLLIVIAIFGLVIAGVFKMYPEAVFAVWMEIPIAVLLGYVVYKKKGNLRLFSTIAVFLMYITVVMGHHETFQFILPKTLGSIPDTGIWTLTLLTYAFIASTLPVTTLLQPRDYINSWQLFIAMSLLIAGVFASGITRDLSFVAPAINKTPANAPSMVPFIFITIACGAISGFHSLVSTGTSAKQLANETDARMVGYGSMLFESSLAVLVIIATTAGIGLVSSSGSGLLSGAAAWNSHYSDWNDVTKNLSTKIAAFVNGSANMMEALHIPVHYGKIIIGVFIASFAGTTLDTATRIQRYVVAEMFSHTPLTVMTRKVPATGFAVLTAAALAFATGASGAGALKLWPMFGAVNQLLAGLALLLITRYLKGKGGKKMLVTLVPCIIILIMTLWGLVANEMKFLGADSGRSYLLIIMNALILVLAIWMIIESIVVMTKKSS